MKLLKTIQFKDFTPEEVAGFKIRRAARAVVFDQEGKVGLLHVTLNNYHKLPGGGLEGNEDILTALRRECLEEIGCNIDVLGEIGEVIEYRDKWSLKQHSYCYLAQVSGEKGRPDFTQDEIDEGFEMKWVTLSEAIDLLERDKPLDYEGGFIQIRDTVLLKEALSLTKE